MDPLLSPSARIFERHNELEIELSNLNLNFHEKETEKNSNNQTIDQYKSQNNKVKGMGICKNVLECIGNTPMVRLNKIPKEEGISCEIVVKCEYFNAGGSVKDRIAKRMIEAAELDGTLNPNDPSQVIIEPTSGNTGIGLALAGAVKGYNVIITLPDKMSNEKVNILKGLGAEVLRTPTEAASESPESHISLARRLNKEIPNSVILDQYSNPNNPLAHYHGTAEEIISTCGDHLDMAVVSAGTGGTISGIAKRLKERYPNIVIVGVDPLGSILSDPQNLSNNPHLNIPYQVEGIGYDFVPQVLDSSNIDTWITSIDIDAFRMARRLIRSEGLLCGGSSGSATWAALQAAKQYGMANDPSKRIAIILPDSIRNYMSKFLSPEWMFVHKFMSIEEFSTEKGVALDKKNNNNNNNNENEKSNGLKLFSKLTIKSSDTIEKVIEKLENSVTNIQSTDQFPVINETNNQIIGNFDCGKLLERILIDGIEKLSSYSLSRFVNKEFFTFKSSDDHKSILIKTLGKFPIYLVQESGHEIAELNEETSQVQVINPFSFLL